MRRRTALALAGAATVAVGRAHAQGRRTGALVGVLSPLSQETAALNIAALRKGLAELGYVEGRNLTLVLRYMEGRIERVPQLAAELGPQGITANAIRAGVTDTPALQKIPRHDQIIAEARRRNPSGRMTTTEDVARAIVVLSHPDTYWITGNVIGVDGGEDIVG